VIECDLTRDGDVERAVAQTVLERGRLDIVFANAGFGGAGLFSTLTLDHPGSGQTDGSPRTRVPAGARLSQLAVPAARLTLAVSRA